MSRGESKTRILDAALGLVVERGGADVTMAEIAGAAGVSRQAVYLHFADRAALLVALVRHLDEKRGLAEEIRRIGEQPTGADAVRAMISLQARLNRAIWPVARALDAVRRSDEAAERSWQDRLHNRLEGCRRIIARLEAEGTLRSGVDAAAAADLLWTLTSLRMWEDLVLERGWSARRYEQRVTELVLGALVAPRRRG